MARKRAKTSTELTVDQREALAEAISCALQSAEQIPWRSMSESAVFAGLTYETLRREGKGVMRQLSGVKSGVKTLAKRRIQQVEEANAEPEPLDDRVGELEALVAHKNEVLAGAENQIEALKLQVQQLRDNKDEELADQEKLHRQVEALQQCVAELSTIIASKDALLNEANARHEALKEEIRRLADE
jgi:chromosome segregation ATPase